MPTMEFYSANQFFARVKLDGEDTLIGRSDDCHIQLPNAWVSRHHARIIPSGDGLHRIENLGTNGTRLNAEMIQGSMKLRSGDRIYIESYVLVYRAEGLPTDGFAEVPTTIGLAGGRASGVPESQLSESR